ncbi:MAG TPA: hypothetical protein VI916_15415 [Acidimicrobiia bacterium]|nr:hypothetical protein [Acidimicrobiia bacterium]
MPQRRFTPIPEGTKVRVRSRFEGTWAGGFEIAGLDDVLEDEAGAPGSGTPRYRVRRITDRRVLPIPFDPDEVVLHEHPGFDAQFWPGLPHFS